MSFLEHKIPPPVVALFFGICMWFAAQLGLQINLPLWLSRTLTAATLILGLLLPIAGSSEFRKVKTIISPLQPEQASTLVTSGVFHYSSNPMYLGISLILVAWAIYLSSLGALMLVPIFMLYIDRFQIQPEERALAAKFGDEFDSYRQSVRRWL
jgi:protein-S-isoprenylcysteine O-methyltransferase Ste14